MIPFQNELSGWEGPPAQGSQRVGGASCSGSWVGWRVDCPILPKIGLWKNETLTFLDELIALLEVSACAAISVVAKRDCRESKGLAHGGQDVS